MQTAIAYIEALGFRVYADNNFTTGRTGVIYCKTFDKKSGIDCLCNDRAPQVVITPYVFEIKSFSHESFSVELTGEDNNGNWPHISYSLKPEEISTTLEKVIDKLYAAWNLLAKEN